MPMQPSNERDAKEMLANPYYTVVFAEHLFKGSKPAGAKEDWVLMNAKLIDDLGAKVWLGELLAVLSTQESKYDGHDIINPCLVVTVSVRLHGEHPPLITRQQWLEANTKLIKELGTEPWLWNLLAVLETGGPQID
jgi:hypothetical protein